jgi:FkbM family methyltransferase
MSIDLDTKWLRKQAADKASRDWIDKIIDWRNYVLKNNTFLKGQGLFYVNLGQYRLCFKECSAFSTIEVYQELFRRNNHFLVPEFSGKNAAVVVDIGANEGYYILKLRENNPSCRVIAVEPNPYVFEILQKNIEANQIKNIEPVNKAVGPKNGNMNFEIIKEIGAISSHNINLVERKWMKTEFIEKITVDAITLNALFVKHNLDSVDILKMDVEGLEAEILAASSELLKNKVRCIVLERHSRELRDTVNTILSNAGFKLVYEEDPHIEKYYGDMYFVNEKINRS